MRIRHQTISVIHPSDHCAFTCCFLAWSEIRSLNQKLEFTSFITRRSWNFLVVLRRSFVSMPRFMLLLKALGQEAIYVVNSANFSVATLKVSMCGKLSASKKQPMSQNSIIYLVLLIAVADWDKTSSTMINDTFQKFHFLTLCLT